MILKVINQICSFSAIQLSTLESIVGRRYLNLYSEFSLFNSAIQWSINECKRQSMNSNDWNVVRTILENRLLNMLESNKLIWTILSSVLRHLRFLTMTNEEFCRIISQTSEQIKESDEHNENSFLNHHEQIGIFMNLAIPGIVPIPKGLNQRWLFKFI